MSAIPIKATRKINQEKNKKKIVFKTSLAVIFSYGT